MWSLFGLFSALLVLLVPAVAGYDELESNVVKEVDFDGSQPMTFGYIMKDFESRIDVTMWCNSNLDVEGSVYIEEYNSGRSFFTIQPRTTNVIEFPGDFVQSPHNEPVILYIKFQSGSKYPEDKLHIYLSDGFELQDGVTTMGSLGTDFVGEYRYYKFFVCESEESIEVSLDLTYEDLKGTTSLYISTSLGKPSESTCTQNNCILRESNINQDKYTATIKPELVNEEGWIYIGLKTTARESFQFLGLKLVNMQYTKVYTQGGNEEPSQKASLCLYESCSENFEYEVDPTQSLSISAWSDNRNKILAVPLFVSAALAKGAKHSNLQSQNGFIYVSAEDMEKKFGNNSNKAFYISVNNQIPITYPSLGADLESPVKLGICKGCQPLFPHGSKTAFKASNKDMGDGRFVIPFGYDLRAEPYYTNIHRNLNDPKSPLRPSYAITFRNAKNSSNVCGWELLLSTDYSDKTKMENGKQVVDETYFDAVLKETGPNGGGSGIEIDMSTKSLNQNLNGDNPDEYFFYREDMTVFGRFYPYSYKDSTDECANDINYLYVGDIHEMNPEILCGTGCNIEPEMEFTAEQRSDQGYYSLHLKVTLTDELIGEDSPNFVISVTALDGNNTSAKIVGSSQYCLPDPAYDGEIVSNGGFYDKDPYVNVHGHDYKDFRALYFTVDFLTSSTVTVKFSRDEKVITHTQGFAQGLAFKTSEYLLSCHLDATANQFSKMFFAAMLTTTSQDTTTHQGVRFCVNDNPTTRPSAKCESAMNSGKIELATNTNSVRKTILKNLNPSMENSASYVRVVEHPKESYHNKNNSSLTYKSMFGVYIELDGSGLKGDSTTFRFDPHDAPIYFKMVFQGHQDGLFSFKTNGDISNGDSSASVDLIICPDFPPITEEDFKVDCDNISINATGGAGARSVPYFMGQGRIPSTTNETVLWAALFPHSVKVGGEVEVEFSQSECLSESSNNGILIPSSAVAYRFGVLPLSSGNDDPIITHSKYLVGVTGLNRSGEFYYSQTEIHPSGSNGKQYKLAWPGQYILSLQSSPLGHLDGEERIYFGFKANDSLTSTAASINVNVNRVYTPDYSAEPLTYHPKITSSEPLVAYYDVTNRDKNTIPYGAVSYYFYPFDTNDTKIVYDDTLFSQTSSFTILGGSNINHVNNPKNKDKAPHSSVGKGIHVMTIDANEITPDVDGNNHMYFGVYKDYDNIGPNPTIATVIFDIVNTSFTLTDEKPIDSTIIGNTGYFKQESGLEYVPILLNYNVTEAYNSVQLYIETCRLNTLSDGTHQVCISRYVHNPAPNVAHTERCIALDGLNDDRAIKLDADYISGYNTFYAIHSGVGSQYRFTLRLEYEDRRPETTDPNIGYVDFVKNKSVTLKVVPMRNNEESATGMVPAALTVYYFETSITDYAYHGACGYQELNKVLLSLSSVDVQKLIDNSTDGMVALNVSLESLDPAKEYFVNIVGSYNGFSRGYNPIRIIPGKSISGIDVTPPPDLWWVWLIVAIVAVAIVALVLIYIFYWRPKSIEKKQYQELDERNDGKAEAIAIEDDNPEPLA